MKNLVIVFFFFVGHIAIAQDNVWLMGSDYSNIDTIMNRLTKYTFYPDTLIVSTLDTESQLQISSSSLCVSKDENILFYSNGLTLFNAENDTMLNAQGFNQSSPNAVYLQSNGYKSFNWFEATLYLPDLKDSTKHHIFHSNYEYIFIPPDSLESITYHIDETIIDITGDNGKGAVISKNIPILTGAFHSGYLTACKHGNGKDWWLLIPEHKNNVFRRLLYSASGIADKGTQAIGSVRGGDEAGVAIFSPDGFQYAISNTSSNYPFVRLFDFDRCRGLLSNPRQFTIELKDLGNMGDASLGMSFSPSNRFLYVTTSEYVWQYDTWAADISLSKIKVAEYDGYICYFAGQYYGHSYFHTAQIGANGKIYIGSLGGTNVSHVIEYPDSLGLACQVKQHFVLNPSPTQASIPIYPNYHLGALPDPCPTVGIEEETLNSNLVTVYPNPASGRVRVYLDKAVSLPATFSIYDAYGREVYRQSLLRSDIEIPLGGLGKGMYIYEVITDNYKSYGKLWVE